MLRGSDFPLFLSFLIVCQIFRAPYRLLADQENALYPQWIQRAS